DQEYIDTALGIRWELEDLVQNQSYNVAFVLDNFEGVAHLPLRDSEWLRSMAKVCTYVVASRDLLYLLYHPSNWSTPSTLWNLFMTTVSITLPDRFACNSGKVLPDRNCGVSPGVVTNRKKQRRPFHTINECY